MHAAADFVWPEPGNFCSRYSHGRNDCTRDTALGIKDSKRADKFERQCDEGHPLDHNVDPSDSILAPKVVFISTLWSTSAFFIFAQNALPPCQEANTSSAIPNFIILRFWNFIDNGVKNAIAASLNQVLKAEIEVFLGSPGQEDNKRNGYTERDYALKHIDVVRVRQPNDRKKRFSSAIIPKHERMDPRISEDLAALSLAGLSTRTLALISHRILGIEVSHGTVANALPVIAEGAEKWTP